jgi:hypothetical protein
MNVYAPANEALVLFTGEQIEQSSLLDAVKRLLGFVGVFAVGGLPVDRVARQIASDTGPPTSGMVRTTHPRLSCHLVFSSSPDASYPCSPSQYGIAIDFRIEG